MILNQSGSEIFELRRIGIAGHCNKDDQGRVLALGKSGKRIG